MYSVGSDNAWSLAVKERVHYKCQIGLSGCMTVATDAMHIIKRGHWKLRKDLDNGLAGCRYCHNQCEAEKIEFIELVERIEPDQFQRLSKKYYDYYKKIL